MDGDLGSSEGDTIELVRELRPKFHGMIIAITGNVKLENPMLEAGCDLKKPKPFDLEQMKELLS